MTTVDRRPSERIRRAHKRDILDRLRIRTHDRRIGGTILG